MARDKSKEVITTEEESRGIATFGKVVGEKPKPKNIDTNIDSLDDRLKRGIPKESETKFRGYYIEEDITVAIDIASDGREKGYKSFLVNEILKEYFQKKGLL